MSAVEETKEEWKQRIRKKTDCKHMMTIPEYRMVLCQAIANVPWCKYDDDHGDMAEQCPHEKWTKTPKTP